MTTRIQSAWPLLLLSSCVTTASSEYSRTPDDQPPAKAEEYGVAAKPSAVSIPYQKFVLDNGLELVVHEDHSNPVVAVYLYYHVGSAREVRGRSGFAHLFEHMLFQGSEHVGDEQHFRMVQEAGGTLNGSTTTDRTNYFEVLPSNQLELAMWLESDRMGFLLPAMTQAKLDNQRDVVKNERRQNYENRPYGQAEGVIAAAMYPPEHPYSWITIGSQEDLTAASLDDVKGFFKRWYGPNNATVAVGGDVKTEEVLALAKKYFGTLPRGPEVDKPAPRPVKLAEPKRLIMEDRVKLPELQISWPGVPSYAADEPALDALASILAANKSAVLDKALTIDEQLASQVSSRNESRELAGEFRITVRPHKGVTLDTLEAKVNDLIAKLAHDGVDAAQLERVKSRYESATVRRQETVGQRVSTLANYNTFTKNPGYFDEDMRRHMAVTAADVNRVLKQYVVGKPAVILSIVPEAKKELAAAKSATDATGMKASTEIAWKEPGPKADEGTRAHESAADSASFDRTKKPGPGAPIAFRQPAVWHAQLDDGVSVVGTPYAILPITTLQLSVPAGQLHETMSQLGLASMTADLLQQGTRSLTATEFTEALDALGATLTASAGDEEVTFTLTCLDKHLDKAVELLAHVVLEPRFSAEDFKRIQKDRLVAIETRSDQIRVIAGDVYRRLLWGDTVAGMPTIGTHDSVQKMTLDDVKAYWRDHGSAAGARLTFVGQRDGGQVKKLFAPLTGSWKATTTAKKLELPAAKPLSGTKLYFVDKPGAPQSELRIGHVSLASTDRDFYPLTVLNYPLGGLFSSRVNLNLREDKGYTYGARTAVEGGYFPGAFTASAGVKTDVTKESVAEFLKELNKIKDGITEKELAFTKDSIAEGTKRQYESVMALSGMLDNISRYDWPDDYAAQRLKELDRLTLDDMKRMATQHLHPDAMVVLVVGDKKKVAKGLGELGLGEPIELDIDGNPIEKKVGTN
jgi:zinc protease